MFLMCPIIFTADKLGNDREIELKSPIIPHPETTITKLLRTLYNELLLAEILYIYMRLNFAFIPLNKLTKSTLQDIITFKPLLSPQLHMRYAKY